MRSFWLVALTLATLVSGCKRDEVPPGGPTQTDAAEVAPAPDAVAVAADAAPAEGPVSAPMATITKVDLLEPGKAPRTPLRYALALGKQTSEFSLLMTMDTSAGGVAAPKQPLPEIVMTMDTEVLEVLPDGGAKVRFTFTKVDAIGAEGVNPMVLSATKSALAAMAGLTGTGAIDARGFYTDVKLSMPPGLNPQVRQTMENTMQTINQVSSPLPEEPVGAGAKWKVTQQLNQGGLVLDQEITYTLGKRTAESASLAAVIDQHAGEQTMSPQGMGGAKVKVISVKTTGRGTIDASLTKMMPRKAAMNMESKAAMEMAMPGGDGTPQRMDMSTTVKMTVGSK